MFDIQEELKKLPAKPGVYLMHDKNDAIIYVGKAVSLKNRVRQYFQSSRGKGAKIEQMVQRIARFEYIVTDSELEALVLECNLIKEHRPKYNTMLKDDKSYPFIKVTLEEEYPRVVFSRTMKKDRNKYYGPYTSAGAVKDTIDLISRIYRLRTCSRKFPRDIGKERPCLNYQIGRCSAPCQGKVSREEYRRSLEGALNFLNGNYEPILAMLERRMQEASERMDFEEAIVQRDLMESVRQIAQKQKVMSSDGEDKDVIGCAIEGTDAVAQVFFIRQGRLIGREHFFLRVAPKDTSDVILSSFLKQFYAGTPFIPREIIVPQEVEDREVLEEWLTGRRGQHVHLRAPRKGVKEELVELAARNAQMVLSQDRERIRREEGRTIGAMKEIASWIGLKDAVRVEAYDISDISGFESVGSMAVFERGKPKRSDYRKFRIRTVKGANDYASLEEMLVRRFTHEVEEEKKEYDSFAKLPDLILIDGGKGQVHRALAVLERLGLSIPVCGMVKDDAHRTRGVYYEDREIPISKDSEGFRLVARIQDEAHRFAVEYHRSLRSKEQVHSVLDDIAGIGPARRKALMRCFDSLEAVREAGVEELMAVPSMTEASARSVYAFFHDGAGTDSSESTDSSCAETTDMVK